MRPFDPRLTTFRIICMSAHPAVKSASGTSRSEDHLRTHPQDACTYAILKRELAGKFGDDREAYTQAKSEFVASILRRTGRDSTP